MNIPRGAFLCSHVVLLMNMAKVQTSSDRHWDLYRKTKSTSWFVIKQLHLLSNQNYDQGHHSQIILSLSDRSEEKRPNYQYKGPICRRIGNALHNLMKYLNECPCDNHVRRHCLITRASKLASNWFTWNVGGIFLALYVCFM